MKKNLGSASARYLSRARQLRAFVDAERRRRYRLRVALGLTSSHPRPPAAAANARRPISTIVAPEEFDLVNNPSEFLATFERIEDAFRRQREPRLDFSQQTIAVSGDAILAMLALGTKLATKYQSTLRLRLPTDEKLRDVMKNSGLISYLSETPPEAKDVGMIRRRQNEIVSSATAQELIIFATQTLFGERRRNYASYTTYVECMGNTFEHSNRIAGEERWWAYIYCDGAKAQCTFIDTGIGIFSSLKFKGLWRRVRGQLTSKTDLLRQLLERKIGSRSGESYRNRGLPKIYANAKHGLIRNLIIITDDVYASVDRDEFLTMDHSFKGTFYHWELV